MKMTIKTSVVVNSLTERPLMASSNGSDSNEITPNSTMNTLMTRESKGLDIKVLTVIIIVIGD